jgi:DNA-binding Xre family transcriptional regulator
MGTDLKDRLALAIERRKCTVRDLVETTGLTKSAIHFLLNGTTRPETVRAWNIDLLSDALNVSRDWLLYGKGHMNRQETGASDKSEGRLGSQSLTLDPATLTRAEFWLRVEERAADAQYPQDLRRAERIIALYQMVQAGGGDLTAEEAIELVETARTRIQGATNGRSKTGGGK